MTLSVPLSAPPPNDDYSPLAYALRYVALGWAVLPLHTITDGLCSCGDPACDKVAAKHPLASLVPRGLHQATTDPGMVRAWWRTVPEANIGVRTGRVSGFVAVDIDVRESVGGEESWAALTAAHGTPPATVEAITGSGGRHLLYAYPDDVQLGNTAGKLGPGLDTRGDGGYIVVEPSRHRSGGVYLWEASSSPLEDVAPAPMPGWMVDKLRESRPVVVAGIDAPPLPAERVRELRSALTVIPADERDVWIRVGMALHSEHPGPQGYGLWTEWSQQSDKYDPRDQQRTWSKFRPEKGVTASSIFALARECGWVAPEVTLVDPGVREFAAGLTEVPPALVLHREPEREIPQELLSPPGVLGDVVRYGLETAVRPVPVFAVQAALALGSVVCARRYVTTQRNYASLYFLSVGKSGVGKEHGKTTIEAILTAANQRKLVGGASFSSGGAVYSALLAQPQHVAILDEFGRYMESAAASRDNHRSAALTMLMEAFGRCHADMSTPRYSSMTAPRRQVEDTEPRIIARPAITLLALTTPATFYSALTSTRVLDGFLNRFIVAEHTGPRVPARDFQDADVPPHVVSWVQQVLAPHGDLDVLTRAEHIGPPRVVGFTSDALQRSSEMERETLALADRLERDGLGDMPIRSREIALRLALVLALSYDVEAPVITGELMDWSARYVTYHGHQTIEALRSQLADSETERTRNMLLGLIRATGSRGLTVRELHRTRGVTAVRKADREAALESLLTAELVAWTDVPHGPTGGRPRRALVALADLASDS